MERKDKIPKAVDMAMDFCLALQKFINPPKTEEQITLEILAKLSEEDFHGFLSEGERARLNDRCWQILG